MQKKSRLNLNEIPWPANLLKCSQYTDEMKPGEELDISLDDPDVKDSLLLILGTKSNLVFEVSVEGSCFTINVTKKGSGFLASKGPNRDP